MNLHIKIILLIPTKYGIRSMPNSQNKENPDSNDERRRTAFGIGQAFTAAAASLRAAGTRAQELVEGTTNAVLSSLPLSRIIGTERVPLSVPNNNVPTENEAITNALTLANTLSRTSLSIKGSCVIETDIAEETAKGTENVNASVAPAGETTTDQSPADQTELPNNDFFKGSSIIKTNLQLVETKESTKGTENLKAPAVQTPAGQSILSNIDFFNGSFIIKTNIKYKLADETSKVSENQNVPPAAQAATDQLELPYIDFFKGFSNIKSNVYLKQAEETVKGTEYFKTPTAQIAVNQSKQRLQLHTPTEKAGTSVEPGVHVQTNLQTTGTQTDDKNESVVKRLTSRRQIKKRRAESGPMIHISKTRRLEVLAQDERSPSFITEHRLSDLARLASATSQTRQYLIDASKPKRIIVSSQPETTTTLKTDRRHSNISQRAEINLLHHRDSSELDTQTAIPASTSRRISSYSGRRMLTIEPTTNLTSHNRTWDGSTKFSDLSLHRPKARRLSEVVDQRRRMSGIVKTITATIDSRTETNERNEAKDRRARAIPSASVPSMLHIRSENVRARRRTTEARAAHRAPAERRNKFFKVLTKLFGRCTGYSRRH